MDKKVIYMFAGERPNDYFNSPILVGFAQGLNTDARRPFFEVWMDPGLSLLRHQLKTVAGVLRSRREFACTCASPTRT